MKMQKTLLLTSAAVVALGLGTSSKAHAFDTVDWVWNKTLTSTETVDVDIDVISPDATGIVELEKIQMNIGDVTATSSVSGIENNPPGEMGDGTFTGVVSVDVDYEDIVEGVNAPINATLATGGDITSAEFHEGNLPIGTFDAGTGLFSDNLEIEVSGQIDVEDLGINDAVDLPSVESAATAVANNQAITSSVGISLHDAQINFGGFDGETNGNGLPVPAEVAFDAAFNATDNTNTNLMLAAGLSGALGIITPGSVTATSTVDDITNASVDSAATAVGNNLSVELVAFTPDDAFALADVTQFNYADIDASSAVTGVSVDNYANMGALEGPLVNSIATAVGNNTAITVSSVGAVDLP